MRKYHALFFEGFGRGDMPKPTRQVTADHLILCIEMQGNEVFFGLMWRAT
jgi:hypothetical protein